MLPASQPIHLNLPTYQGPLDLLLHLIRKNQVEISDIPIVEITRQYLDTIALWESLDLAVAGEYLVMAATLIEIKSRMLLPTPPSLADEETEADPRAELVERLREYEQFRGTVDTMREWEAFRKALFFRDALENPDDYLLPVESGVLGIEHLAGALRAVLERAGLEGEIVTAVVPRRRVTLRMKMAELLSRVRSAADGVDFADLVELPCARIEVVLLFLALLELLRMGRIAAAQGENLGAIRLTAVPEEEP